MIKWYIASNMTMFRILIGIFVILGETTELVENYSEICLQFSELTYDIRVNTHLRGMTLLILSTKLKTDINVSAYATSCNFKCDGKLECPHYEEKSGIIPEGAHNISFFNFSYPNVCFILSPSVDPVCVITTDSELILEPQKTAVAVPYHTSMELFFIIFGLITVMALIIIAIVIVKYQQKKTHLASTRYYQCNDNGSAELLLLYSNDSEKFCNLVVAFRKLLESANIKVIDPFDKNIFEEVAFGPSAWLRKYLSNIKIKIAILMSDGANMRYKALLSNKRIIIQNPHCLDNIFTFALDYVIHNPSFNRDYSRVFAVRFGKYCQNMEPAFVTPFRCFIMPQHFKQFITALIPESQRKSASINMDDYDENVPLSIDFQELITSFEESQESHIDYIKNKFKICT